MEELKLDSLLAECRVSATNSYAQFKLILQHLDNPETRVAARKFLTQLRRHVSQSYSTEECMSTFYFKVHDLTVARHEESEDKQQTLQLLELPGIFTPERWSFTFFEGLARFPEAFFRGRDVSELGCGNGWVSIALAKRSKPRKVYGLDINPRAIRCARINLYLNGLSDEGEVLKDDDGLSVLDRVEFYESDLLGYVKDNNIALDRVVGCIPQVLSPDPEETLRLVSEWTSEEVLANLGNYCERQGYVEDQFGLGLIARALEESIQVLRPTGSVIMNLGGRPGKAVLERMFQRRGYNVSRLWGTRVQQAADTDIQTLVEIEHSSRLFRFEFFMGHVSEEPISARTAWAYAKQGGEITHGLWVYEASLPFPEHIKTVFKYLQQPDYAETRSALDLSFTDKAVAEEKVTFLAYLANSLTALPYFPYDDPAGTRAVRSKLAKFLKAYYGVPWGPDNVVITPSRGIAVRNVLDTYGPGLSFVDKKLTHNVPTRWLCSIPLQSGQGPPSPYLDSKGKEPVVLEIPRRGDLVCKLMLTLKPRVVVAALADHEMRSASAFQQLIKVSAEIGCRLFLDISDYLDLSSSPATNGVLEYLSENPLPPHCALLCGLVNNRVYGDLRICAVLSENKSLLNVFADSAEFTYCRTPSIPQRYYECLIGELLSFQFPVQNLARARASLRTPQSEHNEAGRFIDLRACVQRAFGFPALVSNRVVQSPSAVGNMQHRPVVRMDYGENEFPAPSALRQYLFESFARQNLSDAEADPGAQVKTLLARRLCLKESSKSPLQLVYGHGVTPLYAGLMAACSQEGGVLLYPQGAYCSFQAAAEFFGVQVLTVKTNKEDDYKITAAEIKTMLHELGSNAAHAWLYLNAPIVNPTGAEYTQQELVELMKTFREAGGRLVILDAQFAGLLHAEDSATSWDLSEVLTPSMPFAIIAGISKEFAAGGLRFGFAATQDAWLSDHLRDEMVSMPHCTLRHTVKHFLSVLHAGNATLLSELREQRRVLHERTQTMVKALRECGWDPIEPKGGLFLVAKPVAFMGKEVSYETLEGPKSCKIDGESISKVLYYKKGLLVNNEVWTGIKGYCRFVISSTEKTFQEGLVRLREFRDELLGQ